MLTVHKYTLAVTDEFVIGIPEQAKLLHVDMQHDQPRLWALVHTERPMTMRRFRLVGTGHPIEPPTGVYVGSFFMSSGALVWHLFDLGEVAR